MSKIQKRTSITERLDRVATELEQAGRPDMALAIDKVSDRLDNAPKKKIVLKRVGPHTFIEKDDPTRQEMDSDDVQWHCPKCHSKWNEAGVPCDCGQESPFIIEHPGKSATEESNKKTVGINDFVKRQTDSNFVGTKISSADLEKLRKEAEKQINAGQDKEGYAKFVRIVSVKEPSILCPIAEVTPKNEKYLKTEKTKRREGEEEYEHKYFLSSDVKGIPSHHVDIILYSKEQLEKEGEKNTGSDFDIISVNAQFSEKGAPITPETMRRNIKGPDFGGSGFQHTQEEIADSTKFWDQYAMIK